MNTSSTRSRIRPRNPSRQITPEERNEWNRALDGLNIPSDDDEPAPTALPARRRARGPAVGLDKRTEQKLRRGLIAPEDRLDLHGNTLASARERLEDFIEDAQAEGLRCVLVITGRKLSEAGPEGVLWKALPALVRSPPLARHVIRAVPAHRKHGGDGAFYLYLSRRTRGST